MRLLILCESCDKEYPQTEMHRLREDDEGGYWDCCQACWDAITDLGEEFWSNSNREAGHG